MMPLHHEQTAHSLVKSADYMLQTLYDEHNANYCHFHLLAFLFGDGPLDRLGHATAGGSNSIWSTRATKNKSLQSSSASVSQMLEAVKTVKQEILSSRTDESFHCLLAATVKSIS